MTGTTDRGRRTDVETRKVQKVGSGTFTVSLPKAWAESQGVGAGTVVELHPSVDGVLRIEARERRGDATGRVAVEVDHDDPANLERTLRAAYAAGFEELVLTAGTAFTDEQRARVGRVARTLVGVTVPEESESRVVVRTLVDAGEVSIRQTVRQLRHVALSMHRDATAALVDEPGGTGAGSPDERDDEADRLFAMVDRHLCRGLSRLDEVDALGIARPELFGLWLTARELEGVADEAERVATIATGIDRTPAAADGLRSVGRTSRGIVEDAVRAVVGDADASVARRALADRDRVRGECEALDRRLFEESGADYRLPRAVDCLRRTAEHGGTVAELALRIAVGRDGSADGADAGVPARRADGGR